MRRFSVQFNAAVSATANTATNAIGLQTGSNRMCAIYEMVAGMSGVSQDATLRLDLYAVSAYSGGSVLTPAPIELGNSPPAANTAAVSGPTVTTSGLSLCSIALNSRATVRWAAVDPDARFLIPAGGGTGGAVVWQNQQPSTAVSLTILHQLYFAE